MEKELVSLLSSYRRLCVRWHERHHGRSGVSFFECEVGRCKGRRGLLSHWGVTSGGGLYLVVTPSGVELRVHPVASMSNVSESVQDVQG
jgi:hypothetical protein